jgi:hypothetical protein
VSHTNANPRYKATNPVSSKDGLYSYILVLPEDPKRHQIVKAQDPKTLGMMQYKLQENMAKV